MKIPALALIVAAALTAGTVLGMSPYSIDDEIRLSEQEYCKMVQLFKKSKGDLGWPDYNGNYSEICTNGQLKSMSIESISKSQSSSSL